MKLRVEHHSTFTAVYIGPHLATIVYVGTQEQRRAIPDSVWYHHATIAATFD